MSDLHALLVAEANRRLEIARAYAGACDGAHWHFCGDECEEFQRTFNSAAAIAVCEGWLDTLRRHNPLDYPVIADCDPCAEATLSSGLAWASRRRDPDCPEIANVARQMGMEGADSE